MGKLYKVFASSILVRAVWFDVHWLRREARFKFAA